MSKDRFAVSKHISPIALLLGFCLYLTLTGCSDITLGSTTSDPPHTLLVTGVGEAQGTPDRFSLRALARQEGDDVSAMQHQVDQLISQALNLARQLGIAEQQINATALSVQPQWQWQPERQLTGYQVTRDIRITVEGLDTWEHLLEGLTRIGFRDIHPMGASISDQQTLEARALENAMTDARRKAEILAKAAGIPLGPVIAIEEQASHQPAPQPMMALRAESTDSAYAPGETRIQRQLQVHFRLESGQ